jgi:hypothetical protein
LRLTGTNKTNARDGRAHQPRQGGAIKKSFVLIAAIVAVVGFGAVAAVGKEGIKVGTSVTLRIRSNLNPRPPTDSFLGQVRARKKGCEKGRTVTLNHGSTKVGSDKTNNRGRYKIFFGLRPGGFVAVAKRTMTKDNGNKIVCKADTSNRLTFP